MSLNLGGINLLGYFFEKTYILNGITNRTTKEGQD